MMPRIITVGAIISQPREPAEEQHHDPSRPDALLYEEDFTDYVHKDTGQNVTWDKFNGRISLTPSSGGAHREPAFVLDGIGGGYVAWSDLRNNNGDGNWDVYVQRVDNRGNRLWSHDVRVNSDTSSKNQSKPSIAVDSIGNLLVVWVDDRHNYGSVYAQKLASDGTKLWPNDIEVISSGSYRWGWGDFMTLVTSCVVDQEDNMIVVWTGVREGKWDPDIYAQKINAYGQRLWPQDITVNDDVGHTQLDPALDVDKTGTISITWTDDRLDGQDIYFQRLDTDGNRKWDADIKVSSGNGISPQGASVVLNDNNGNSYVVWRKGPILPPIDDDRNTIYVQKVGLDGSLVWTSSFRVNQDTSHAYRGYPRAHVSEKNDLLVVWRDDRNGFGRNDIYGQLIRSDGKRAWIDDTLLSPIGWDDQWLGAVDIHNGQAFFAWMKRDDVYFNRLDLETRELLLKWPNLVNEADGQTAHKHPDIAMLENERMIIVWHSFLTEDWGIRAQMYDLDGWPIWKSDIEVGNPDFAPTSWRVEGRPQVASNTKGYSMIVWKDTRRGIFARLVDQAGNKQWANDLRINIYDRECLYPSVISLPDGTFVISWLGRRSEGSNIWDIYMQRVHEDEHQLWEADVKANRDDYSIFDLDARSRPELAIDDTGHIIIAWRGNVHGEVDIYIRRFDSEGTPNWSQEVAINSSLSKHIWYSGETMLSLAADNEITIVWVLGNDHQIGIAAQRLDKDGEKQWGDGVYVSMSERLSYYGNPNVALLWNGDAIIIWDDERKGRNIYGQRLDSEGNLSWPYEPTFNEQYVWPLHPALGIGSDETLVVVWHDERDSNERVYANRFDADGTASWNNDLQINPRIPYHHRNGTITSLTVDSTLHNIVQLNFSAEQTLNGGDISYYFSNNGGADWERANEGQRHEFETVGSDLRWKAVLRSNHEQKRTPVVERIVMRYDTDLSGDLTVASPLVLSGYNNLVLAQIRSKSEPLPGLDSVRVEINGQIYRLYDDGTNGDFQAQDGLYARKIRLTGAETYELELFVLQDSLDNVTVYQTESPELVVLTDWTALYQEYRDTGMDKWEDSNSNGNHDFFELVDRIQMYAAANSGIVVDARTEITTDAGFAQAYADIPYSGPTANRHMRSLLIDQLIEMLNTESSSSVANIAIVGDDEVIPFYRVYDPTDFFGKYYDGLYQSKERQYPEDIGGIQENLVIQDIANAYIMSDVPYSIAARQVIIKDSWYPHPSYAVTHPIPSFGIGRIFSAEPIDLIHAINRYEDPIILTPGYSSSSSFAGHKAREKDIDFGALIRRSPSPIVNDWFQGMNRTYDYTVEPWLIDDFQTEMKRSDLVTFWGHSNHKALNVSIGISIESESIADLHLTKPKVLIGFGCHMGLSVSDYPNGPGSVHHYDAALVNALISNGVTYFAPTGQAYVRGSDVKSSNLHELQATLFLINLTDRSILTIGEAWKEMLISYHEHDPGFLDTDNAGTRLFHIASAYSNIIYGLPTQPIERVQTGIVSVTHKPDSTLLRSSSLQNESLNINISVPNMIIQRTLDDSSILAQPNSSMHLAPANGPPLPMIFRSLRLPPNFTFTGVRLVEAKSHVHDQPITLAGSKMQTANGDLVLGDYSLPDIYPSNIFTYTHSYANGELSITAVPIQYDTHTHQLTVYDQLKFKIDGIYSASKERQWISTIEINQGNSFRINNEGQPLVVNVASEDFNTIHVQYSFRDRNGYLLTSGRAPLRVIQGITSVKFRVNSKDWLPGTKDLTVSISDLNGQILDTFNAEVIAEGIGINESYLSLHRYTVDDTHAIWNIGIYDETDQLTDVPAEMLLVEVDENPWSIMLDEVSTGKYAIKIPLEEIESGVHQVAIEVTDDRGISARRTWNLYREGYPLFMPIISR